MDQEKAETTGLSRRGFLKAAAVGGAALAATAVGVSLSRNESEPNQETGQQNTYPKSELEALDGIIPRSELYETYHTRIYDLQPSANSNFVVLDFSDEARDTRIFSRLESGRHIDIFLIDNHFVDPNILTPAQAEVLESKSAVLANVTRRLNAVKETNRQEIENNRVGRSQEYQLAARELLNKRTSGQINDDRYIIESQALDYRYGRYIRTEPTNEDLLVGTRMTAVTIPSGTEKDANGHPIVKSYIFMACRNAPTEVTFTSGEEQLTTPSVNALYDTSHDPLQPHPDQSRPTRDNFTIDMNKEEYIVVEGRTLGFDLAHELEHAMGIVEEKDAELRALDYIDKGSYMMRIRTPEGTTTT